MSVQNFQNQTFSAISAPLAHDLSAAAGGTGITVTRTGYTDLTWFQGDIAHGMVGRCVFFLPDGSFSLCNGSEEKPTGLIIKESHYGVGAGFGAGGIHQQRNAMSSSVFSFAYDPGLEAGKVFSIGLRGIWNFALAGPGNGGVISAGDYVGQNDKGRWFTTSDYRGWIALTSTSAVNQHFAIQGR